MFSSVLAICGLLLLEVSSALDPGHFNFEKLDYSHSLYQGIMNIFKNSPNTATLQAVGLISDNLDEFSFPIKRLHEDEKSVILGQDGNIFVDSSFIEIYCRQGEIGEILDNILPRIIGSYTVVVILKDSQSLYFHEIEACMVKVFEKFWEVPIMNVVIMFPSNYKMSVGSPSYPMNIFSYVHEPYNKEPLRNVTGMSFHKIFYDKTANFHLHPLKVLACSRHRFYMEIKYGVMQPSGVDGSLANTLGQIFNATIILNFSINTEAYLRINVSNQYIEQLRNGSIDVWMNVRIIYPKQYEGVVYTYPRERMDIICILPKHIDGQIKYKSISGGRVSHLLIMMGFLFCIVSFFVFLSNQILRQNMPLLKLAKVVLNQSDTVAQKTPSSTIRILFGTWLAGSFVLSTLLQTFITSRIIRPFTDERMNTIQEVVDFGTRLRIQESYWNLTKNHYDTELLSDLKNNIDVVANNELFAVQRPDVGYLTTQNIRKYKNLQRTHIYVLPEIFLPNLIGYYFSKKSPLIRRFNEALTAITETGITQKWEAESQHRFMLTLKNQKKIKPATYITYGHLKSAIYTYCAGLFVAFVVFIYEINF